ncbi:MAG: helix-turn-helix transcriptional regulator [Thermaerobacter sp.]|nr:helix-turn-helix transcriptional regulator [Thermaerobacter sp.]
MRRNRIWLRDIRVEVGFTQAEVAVAIGISQPTYSHFESGIRRPSPETAQKIGNLLKFDWTMFFPTTEN